MTSSANQRMSRTASGVHLGVLQSIDTMGRGFYTSAMVAQSQLGEKRRERWYVFETNGRASLTTIQEETLACRGCLPHNARTWFQKATGSEADLQSNGL